MAHRQEIYQEKMIAENQVKQQSSFFEKYEKFFEKQFSSHNDVTKRTLNSMQF